MLVCDPSFSPVVICDWHSGLRPDIVSSKGGYQLVARIRFVYDHSAGSLAGVVKLSWHCQPECFLAGSSYGCLHHSAVEARGFVQKQAPHPRQAQKAARVPRVWFVFWRRVRVIVAKTVRVCAKRAHGGVQRVRGARARASCRSAV